jgi:membrane protein DedA with SNARE-associated domain
MTEFVNFFLNITEGLGYFGIIILMTIESSFIPFPSEIVIPPAAYLAFKGQMNLFLIIFSGLIGSLLGAIINYYLAYHFGRKMILKLSESKYAKYLLISEENILKSEKFIKHYGAMSTFLGRLMPGIRQLISLPAGFMKMNFLSFLFYTSLGSGIWVCVLACLGYFFGANQSQLEKYYKEISFGFAIFIILFLFFFLLKKFFLKRS